MTLRLIRTIESERLDARDAELRSRARRTALVDDEPRYYVSFDEPRAPSGWTFRYFSSKRFAEQFAAGKTLNGKAATVRECQ